MSHELEFINGDAQVLGAVDMWHRLGVRMPEAFDLDDVRELAPAIASDVYKVPAMYMTNDSVITGGTCGIVREYDGKLVGEGHGIESYGIVQYETMYKLGAAIADVLEAPMFTTGSLREGRQFFIGFRANDLDVNGEIVQRRPAVCSSHDGSLKAVAYDSSVLPVCANTLTWGLSSGRNILGFRHTSGVEDAIAQAIEFQKLHSTNDEVIVKRISDLQLRPFSTADFVGVMDTVLPTLPDSDAITNRAKTIRTNARESVQVMWLRDERVAPFRGTAWGAVQAFNTYEQWVAPIRGLKGRNESEVRAERQFDSLSKGQPLTSKALELVLA